MFVCLRNPKSFFVSSSVQMGVTSSMNARRGMPVPRGLRQAVLTFTMLAPNGDRAVPALFDLLYCHYDACSMWRQGGARITVLSDLCTDDINGYGAVG